MTTLPKPTDPALFIAKVEVQPNGCWHWTGSIDHHGSPLPSQVDK